MEGIQGVSEPPKKLENTVDGMDEMSERERDYEAQHRNYGERLATLETQVRDIREGIRLASVEMNRRLDAMNAVRDQLNRAEDRYLTKDEYNRAHSALIERFNTTQSAMTERLAVVRIQMAAAAFVAAAAMTAFFEWVVRRLT